MEGSGTSAIVTALTTAFTSITSDIQSAFTSILPIALGVLGFGIVVTLGIKMFKKIVGKA